MIVSLSGAPRWAEGPGRPRGVNPGTWRPNARAYGEFAGALAKRYSGSYPDPERPGASLPKVRTYLPWNEPNLDVHLNPQWVRSEGRFRPASPAIYRGLLNAFAAGVKAVDRRNRVVAGATAPFGDPDPGGGRIPPARFVRDLLSRRTIFDVLSHHPYSVRGPRARAYARDDVSVPDMKKLSRPLRRAQRAGAYRLPAASACGWPRSPGTAHRPIPTACPPPATRDGCRSRSTCSGVRAWTPSRGSRFAIRRRARALQRAISPGSTSAAAGRSSLSGASRFRSW